MVMPADVLLAFVMFIAFVVVELVRFAMMVQHHCSRCFRAARVVVHCRRVIDTPQTADVAR